MKKILASILTIAMLMTTLSVSVIPASAENAAVATSNVVFEETFEGYGAQDWTSALDENGYVTGVDNMKAQTWTLYGSTNFNVEGAKPAIKVVEFPAGSGNKALEVNSGSMAANEWFRLRRNAADSNDGMKRTDLTGKVLVIKADIWTSQDYTTAGDTAVFGYDPYKTGSSKYFRGIGRTGGSRSWYLQGIGGANHASATHGRTRYSFPNNDTEVTTVKFVHNLTGYRQEGHEADTFRAFANNTILTVGLGNESTEGNYHLQDKVNAKFPQPAPEHADLVANPTAYGKVIDGWGGYNAFASSDATSYLDFGDFYGASLSISQKSGYTNQVMHMDNLVAYYIDEFKQVGDITYGTTDANGGWYKDGIEIPFNNAIRTEALKETYTHKGGTENNTYNLADLVKVINVETNEALASVDISVANEGKTLVVTPPKGLDAGVEYKIVASPLFMDAEGQGLNIYSKETELTTFTTGVDPYAHIIYDNGFEEYKINGENWYDYVDGDNYVTATGVEVGAFSIHESNTTNEHSAKVVANPNKTGNDSAQVMALSSGSSASGIQSNLKINANGKTGISRSTDMGKGKKLVYEYKFYFPTDFATTEVTFGGNPGSYNQTTTSGSAIKGSIGTTSGVKSFYATSAGTYNYPTARKAYNVNDEKWHSVRHVVDVSKELSATHSDTSRGYFDGRMDVNTFAAALGNKYAHGVNAKYPATQGTLQIDHLPANALFESTDYASFGNFYGSFFNLRGLATDKIVANNTTYYIDDLKAFWIDALTFDTVNADNFEGGKVKLKFNQVIRDEVDIRIDGVNKTYGKEELFKLVDPETKEVVENGIAAVAISEDGKTVSITPSAELEKGGDYQIEISPYLIDEYGQGLENNSTATYIDLHISETFTPFEMTSISQTAVSGFAQGRDVKITAKFSVAVDDEAITNGIVVKNEAGDVIARNNGWTANFGTDEEGNADYKTVVFDFGSLPTDNYEVTINEYFTATNGAELTTAFEITINKANDKIVLFEEDFDTGYTVDENWVNAKYEVTDGTLDNNTTYKSYTVGNHDWDVQLHFSSDPGSTTVTDFIGVVAAPDKATAKMSGNALKIYSNRGTSYARDYISFRRNFNKLNGINFASEQYKGKKLVYEADLYADSVASNNSFFVPFGGTNTKTIRDYNDWKMLFSGGSLRTAGHYEYEFSSVGAMAMYTQVVPSGKITSAPTNYKIVVSMGENIDTTAMYVDGQLVERPLSEQARLVGHEWNDSARHEFQPSDGTFGETLEVNDVLYGIWGLVGQGSETARTVYMDNFKAYLVDEFNVESVEGAGSVFNTAKGAVTYTFSKPVNANVVANEDVVLLDAEGNTVAGGIASITLSDANYKMVVKLSDTLPGLTKYSIKLNETLKDVDGLALSTVWEYYEYPIDQFYTGTDNVYSITTVDGATTADMYYIPAAGGKPAYLAVDATGKNKAAIDTYVRNADAMKMFTELTTSKATSLFADATTATVAGNTVSTSVVFTNPEVAPMNVWCVVAAYGEYNEMLGCTPVDVTEVEASSSTEEIPVTVVTNGGAVKSVKLFVWNSYEDMKPYQKAEEIINK